MIVVLRLDGRHGCAHAPERLHEQCKSSPEQVMVGLRHDGVGIATGAVRLIAEGERGHLIIVSHRLG